MSIAAFDLRRNFGAVRAVDGVTFELAAGEIVGLIGPNGSGKSTILRILATFLRPTAGRVVVAGCDAAVDPAGVRRLVGYVPEALPPYADARVDEFLAFRARLKGIERTGRKQEIDRCLAACDLLPVRRRLLGTLSQGFRRRAGLADALLGSPRVLLLDEPTIGLDPLQVRQTRDVLREAAARATVLLSTHLLSEAQAVCSRVLMMLRGKLVSDVRLEPDASGRQFEITLRAAAGTVLSPIQSVPGVRAAEVVRREGDWTTLRVHSHCESEREQIVRLCVEHNWSLRELRNVEDDLESHFVRVALGLRQEAA